MHSPYVEAINEPYVTFRNNSNRPARWQARLCDFICEYI